MHEKPKQRRIGCLVLGGVAAFTAVPLVVTFFYQLLVWSPEWWVITVGGELIIGIAAIGITFGTQEEKFWT